jgi:hypothetical protein
MLVNRLGKAIEVHLEDAEEPLWWPDLASLLVRDRLARQPEVTEPYSTSKFLGAQHSPQVVFVNPQEECRGFSLQVECFDSSVKHQFVRRGLVVADLQQIEPHMLATIARATSWIALVPTLARTVHSLVRSVHILLTDDPSIDVSFSDPEIPFSIFASVSEDTNAALRTAEAIVHEAMHLQLSLVESNLNLVTGLDATLYSPWKREIRPLSGVVHGLYVFRVIDQWLQQIEAVEGATAYARERRQQIALQAKQIDLHGSNSLFTSYGRSLVDRLQRTTDTPSSIF